MSPFAGRILIGEIEAALEVALDSGSPNGLGSSSIVAGATTNGIDSTSSREQRGPSSP